MNNKEKIVFGVLLVAVLIAGVLLPKAGFLVGSPAGTTFLSAKVAEVNQGSIATAAATTSGASLLNNDASDRIVESVVVSCSGVGTSQTFLTGTGLATLTLTVATSTSAVPNQTNEAVNELINAQVIATSSLNVFSNPTINNAQSRVWASGTYLNFHFNATNTASCLLGAHYVAS